MKRLKIYEIDSDYVRYLSRFQAHIFNSDGDKASRKYIGVILEINQCKYFAPLASFKPKHKRMRESVDLIKIKDGSAEVCYKHLEYNSAENAELM